MTALIERPEIDLKNMATKAYAAKLGSVIIASSVHPHPRGAMVNYLYLYSGQHPLDSWSDEKIREVFLEEQIRMNRGPASLSIVEVNLQEVEEYDVSPGNPIYF